MGSDLRFVMPLLRLLNAEENLRMDFQTLCSRLMINVYDLESTALEINAIDTLLAQDGADLVLLKKLDLLDAKTIYDNVTMRGRFVLKDVSASTNVDLVEEKDNLVSGDALVTEIQTQGRGMHGNKWITSIGTNIMLSMAFKFDNVQQLLGFSLAIGVATVTALEQLGVHNVKLKWPNDVVYNDKKLAGILIDSVPVGDNEVFAIVGTGLNVHKSEYLEKKLARPYTSLEDMGYDISRNDVCINLINEIKYTANIFKKKGLREFLSIWHKHDSLLNRQVEVAISSHRKVEGRVSGVNNLGELILESNSGRTAIRSGHILNARPY